MGLGVGGIVIPAQGQIVEGILARQLNQTLIGGEILGPAFQPVLQVFLRYQFLQKSVFLLLPAGQALNFLLI